jgi:hypothetical protein
VKAIVADALEFADQSPEPPLEALYENVLIEMDPVADGHEPANEPEPASTGSH